MDFRGRRFRRLALEIEVKWHRHRKKRGKASGSAYFLKTKNVAQHGLFLKTEKPFQLGKELDLEFLLPTVSHPIEIMGRVVWVADKDKNPAYYPGIGVRLVKINSEDKKSLVDYLNKKFRNYKDAQELKHMYLDLIDMGARLVELGERHPGAIYFKKAVDNAIKEISEVAHLIDKEVSEIKNL
ncbi:MAG: PilZ domain-containing protein [Candidatus Omnitrophota bacterium]